MTTSFISHYTVQVADFPAVADQGTFTWRNSCDVISAGCNMLDNQGQARRRRVITPLQTTTVTAIHNAAHQVVTAVPVGTTVHDFVTVAECSRTADPDGERDVDWFLNGDCTGAPAANSGPIGPLDASGQFDATGFAFTVNSAGASGVPGELPGWRCGVHASDGACEPLQVVDANIQLSRCRRRTRSARTTC